MALHGLVMVVVRKRMIISGVGGIVMTGGSTVNVVTMRAIMNMITIT